MLHACYLYYAHAGAQSVTAPTTAGSTTAPNTIGPVSDSSGTTIINNMSAGSTTDLALTDELLPDLA